MVLYFVALTWAGFFQGRQMNDANIPFLDIVRYTVPFLRWRSIAGLLMTVGHLAFAFLVLQILRGKGRSLSGPVLFNTPSPPLFSGLQRRLFNGRSKP